MDKELENLEKEISNRLYNIFLIKYEGNKSAFARASDCTEGTIRRVFKNKQSITINLLLRLCQALQISASDLLEGLVLRPKE
jgi:transcriptional regulator with XRE-family HTH domain